MFCTELEKDAEFAFNLYILLLADTNIVLLKVLILVILPLGESTLSVFLGNIKCPL